MSDLKLLALEIETQWKSDERGRLVGTREIESRAAPLMVVAACGNGHVVAFGSELEDRLVGELEAVLNLGRVQHVPTIGAQEIPSTIGRCAELMEGVLRPVEISSGPSYVIPEGTAFASDAEVWRPGDEGVQALRKRNPPEANWSAEEWGLLVDGELGPWAMAVSGGRVVSICHCARLTDRGAEAGVWTDPNYRGRGYAAAVTAAWASLLEGSGRTLFYSTSAENVSSQRVAARLGLRRIGWMWKLSRRRN